MITVHVHDLRLFAHHGVGAEEREQGQRFVFDVELDVGERGADDDFPSAVDYREVARIVKEISDTRQFMLLEALASAIADELEQRFAPDRLTVRIQKPEVQPAGLEGTVGVTVTRP